MKRIADEGFSYAIEELCPFYLAGWRGSFNNFRAAMTLRYLWRSFGRGDAMLTSTSAFLWIKRLDDVNFIAPASISRRSCGKAIVNHPVDR